MRWRDGLPAIDEAVDEVRVEAAPRALAPVDRALFDRGFLRVGDGELLYVRSSRISDPNAPGGRTEATIQMSNFGDNAGFANQLFQYAFLKLYGLRNNAAVETPEWAGEKIFGSAASRPRARAAHVEGRRVVGARFGALDHGEAAGRCRFLGLLPERAAMLGAASRFPAPALSAA